MERGGRAPAGLYFVALQVNGRIAHTQRLVLAR